MRTTSLRCWRLINDQASLVGLPTPRVVRYRISLVRRSAAASTPSAECSSHPPPHRGEVRIDTRLASCSAPIYVLQLPLPFLVSSRARLPQPFGWPKHLRPPRLISTLAPFESPVDPQLVVHLFEEQHPSSASPPPFPHSALERLMVRVCVVNGWVAAGIISPFSSLLSIAQPESEKGNSNYIKFVYLVLFQLIQSNTPPFPITYVLC